MLPLIEEYKLVREEIWKEHKQINSRMTWFLAYQTILVAGVILLISSDKHKELAIAIAIVGGIISILVFISICAAKNKIKKILRPKEKEYKEQ